MKRILLLLVLGFVGVAPGQDAITFTNKLATFTNLQGEVVRDVWLVRADDDGIIYRLSEGVGGGRVCYTNLTAAVLESFGIPTSRIAAAKTRAERKPIVPVVQREAIPKTEVEVALAALAEVASKIWERELAAGNGVAATEDLVLSAIHETSRGRRELGKAQTDLALAELHRQLTLGEITQAQYDIKEFGIKHAARMKKEAEEQAESWAEIVQRTKALKLLSREIEEGDEAVRKNERNAHSGQRPRALKKAESTGQPAYQPVAGAFGYKLGARIPDDVELMSSGNGELFLYWVAQELPVASQNPPFDTVLISVTEDRLIWFFEKVGVWC